MGTKLNRFRVMLIFIYRVLRTVICVSHLVCKLGQSSSSSSAVKGSNVFSLPVTI